jgi:hypothetical protein
VKLVTACAVALALIPACDPSEKPPPAPAGGTKSAALPRESAEPAEPSRGEKAEAPEPDHPPGAVPFDYPAVTATAKKGDYLLAPSKNWIAEAFEKGGSKQTFIYYGGWMLEPGDRASTIKTLTGVESIIPNAMIIPVPAGGTAKPGDILLTTWQSGSGMQRAIVVEGGKPDRPEVRYLDLALDNPSGWGKQVDTLEANTFMKLEHPGQVGTTAACTTGARRTRWIITNIAGDKLLAIGFAGRMRVFQRKDCKTLPIKPRLRAGDKVMVPLVDGYAEAQVEKVDPAIGRVWARYSFGGKDKERAFAFTNVARKLQ